MKKEINLLDCTFRDGGYYNNWNFDKSIINAYFNSIKKSKIRFVELGFRFLDKINIKGPTAYTKDNFINQLKIPSAISIGVMINAGDLLKEASSPLEQCKKVFPNTTTKVKFVRIACHYEEIYKIDKVILWLKKQNYFVGVNLMQISEINYLKIKKVCKYLKKLNIDVLYFADSLGSLNSQTTKKISKTFRKNWDKDLGIHAHNNLGLALSNSIVANNNGVKWIDCTIHGMGRGPGNLRTEDIIAYLFKQKKITISIKKLIKRYFSKLIKQYKWGPNKYYAIAAKNKIHPTYIQKILSDKRYKPQDYLSILNTLKKIGAKKFNPYKLVNSSQFFYSNPKGNWCPVNMFKNRDVLIVGPGASIIKHKKKIENFILKNNILVICINTSKNLNEKLIDFRVACHPMRIMSDMNFHFKNNSKIAMPYTMMPKKIKKSIYLKKSRILDYGLYLNYKNTVKANKYFCELPNPLAIGYSLSIAISGKSNSIYLAGIDGYESNDPKSDETQRILDLFKKRYKHLELRSLTKTKYNLKNKRVN